MFKLFGRVDFCDKSRGQQMHKQLARPNGVLIVFQFDYCCRRYSVNLPVDPFLLMRVSRLCGMSRAVRRLTSEPPPDPNTLGRGGRRSTRCAMQPQNNYCMTTQWHLATLTAMKQGPGIIALIVCTSTSFPLHVGKQLLSSTVDPLARSTHRDFHALV